LVKEIWAWEMPFAAVW